MKMRKYHGLGNDYLIIDASLLTAPLPVDSIRLLCSQHYGAGSDGILTGPFLPGSPDFIDIAAKAKVTADSLDKCICALRILNPDGSEAEKSGNGLRIFSRYLFDMGLVQKDIPFSMLTLGGIVTSTVHDPQNSIKVDMGKVFFQSPDFPSSPELIQNITAADTALRFCPASVGNPHCVVIDTDACKDTAEKYGPVLENHKLFPNRINVQFLKVLDKHNIFIQIWERGAGYTLASGSSASACAAVSAKLGYCQSPISVHMPGGTLNVEIHKDWIITQTGPVELVYELNWLGPELF